MKTETINFDKFLLKMKQLSGWKKCIVKERKTTHPDKIKLMVTW